MKFVSTSILIFFCLAFSTALPRLKLPLNEKLIGSVASNPSATDLTPISTKATWKASMSNLARRESWENVSKSIICNTLREPYRGRASISRVERGYEYLWDRGKFSTFGPNSVDRVSCSRGAGIFIINETPNPIRTAFTRMGDLAREIRIRCNYKTDDSVNGEVTDKDGLTLVVAASNCKL